MAHSLCAKCQETKWYKTTLLVIKVYERYSREKLLKLELLD